DEHDDLYAQEAAPDLVNLVEQAGKGGPFGRGRDADEPLLQRRAVLEQVVGNDEGDDDPQQAGAHAGEQDEGAFRNGCPEALQGPFQGIEQGGRVVAATQEDNGPQQGQGQLADPAGDHRYQSVELVDGQRAEPGREVGEQQHEK